MKNLMKATCLALTCLLWLGCGEASEEDAAVVSGAESSIEGEEGEAAEPGEEEAGGEVAEETGDESAEEAGSESAEEAGEEAEEAGEEGAEEAGDEAGEVGEEEGAEAVEGGEGAPAAVDGIPAPGSICPIPEPWGYAKGDNLKNMAFKNCSGEDVTMYDAACGAAVSWVYFTYGW